MGGIQRYKGLRNKFHICHDQVLEGSPYHAGLLNEARHERCLKGEPRSDCRQH